MYNADGISSAFHQMCFDTTGTREVYCLLPARLNTSLDVSKMGQAENVQMKQCIIDSRHCYSVPLTYLNS